MRPAKPTPTTMARHITKRCMVDTDYVVIRRSCCEGSRAMPALSIALITLGDPNRLTGGYLYHRRLAEAAPRFGARIEFISFPDRPFPLPILAAPRVLAKAAGADVVVLDSIAAA